MVYQAHKDENFRHYLPFPFLLSLETIDTAPKIFAVPPKGKMHEKNNCQWFLRTKNDIFHVHLQISIMCLCWARAEIIHLEFL